MPGMILAALLGGVTVVTALLWRGEAFLMVLVLHMAMLVLDWLSLGLLPRVGWSFGPTKPPLLALTLLRGLLTTFVGLIGGWDFLTVWPAMFLQVVLLFLAVYGLWIEPSRLQITYQTLVTPHFDPTLPPVRLLHLGDLHVERITRRERRLQTLIRELAPDLIVFSGDFVNLSYNQDPQAIEAAHHLVAEWDAPFGVYAVSGSPLVETQEIVTRIVEGTQIQWLRDQVVGGDVRGQPLAIIGLSCAHNIEEDSATMTNLVMQVPDHYVRLLLYHSPDIAPQAAAAGIDLYLCGHTHGGQIRLPVYGALITSSKLGKRYEMGRYRIGSMVLYVTRGIGLEGGSAPRARLMCPPEITLWTISGQ